MVDLTPWRYAIPCAGTLLSCVVGLYLLFSPIGLVGGVSALFLPLLAALAMANLALWLWFVFGRAANRAAVMGVKSQQ